MYVRLLYVRLPRKYVETWQCPATGIWSNRSMRTGRTPRFGLTAAA